MKSLMRTAWAVVLFLGVHHDATAQCCGDCDSDGVTSISELVSSVSNSLRGCQAGTECCGDCQGDGKVSIADLVVAVREASTRCAEGGRVCGEVGDAPKLCDFNTYVLLRTQTQVELQFVLGWSDAQGDIVEACTQTENSLGVFELCSETNQPELMFTQASWIPASCLPTSQMLFPPPRFGQWLDVHSRANFVCRRDRCARAMVTFWVKDATGLESNRVTAPLAVCD